MSESLKDLKDVIDIKEPSLITGCKRRRDSTGTLPTQTKKLKTEPDEEERPASAPPSICGIASNSEEQSPESELIIDEDAKKMKPDESPEREVGIFSDDIEWTPGMIYNLDLEDDEVQNLSSDETASEGEDSESDE